MKISRVQSTPSNNAIQRKSNVNFKAKLEITDEFVKNLDKEIKEVTLLAKNNKLAIASELSNIQAHVYSSITNLANQVEHLAPEDMVIKLDLSDEFKKFNQSGGNNQDFIDGYKAGYYKTCELRFGTEAQQRELKSEGGRAIFNLDLNDIDRHMSVLYTAIDSRLDYFRNRPY